jgi:cytochrome d ubiquinol oxidase subunit I
MEGLFKGQTAAPLLIVGQPNEQEGKIDNPIEVPGVLEHVDLPPLERTRPRARLFSQTRLAGQHPAALLQLSHHGRDSEHSSLRSCLSLFCCSGAALFSSRWMLWILMLAAPFPYIANTAGWMTAELGRQPWLVYGLMRTEDGYSTLVSAGNGMFTLLGFMGMYMVLGILGLFLIWREIDHGPAAATAASNLPQAVR